MHDVVRPVRLARGDMVRVIAPSMSHAVVSEETRAIAAERFDELGLRLTFGLHVEVQDQFGSSPVDLRIADLHDAFADPEVKAVLTVLGGYNANQLLPYIDWDLIAANPKIFCGYSDITALSCAIFAKTGLVTYSGPHYSTFGMRQHCEQNLDWFAAAMMSEAPVVIEPAETWSDDHWYLNQGNRTIEPNDGPWVLGDGAAEGRLIGGNLCTLNLLHGTEYMPDLSDTILFVEDDIESMPQTFDRDLTSLVQQPAFETVRGLLIGRFQRGGGMSEAMLAEIVGSKRELDGLPIVANLDFGHTNPIATLPVGGIAGVTAQAGAARLVVE